MKIAMKKSKVDLLWAIFWAAGALAWLPSRSAAVVDLPGILFSVLCAAACVRQLLLCFRNRKMESNEK
ncbi:MAG: hypothetical protein K2P49_03910 [Oscillospiraceae bacterium]|nr:hypothetical protein [Oscillospiraceae bacterium]